MWSSLMRIILPQQVTDTDIRRKDYVTENLEERVLLTRPHQEND